MVYFACEATEGVDKFHSISLNSLKVKQYNNNWPVFASFGASNTELLSDLDSEWIYYLSKHMDFELCKDAGAVKQIIWRAVINQLGALDVHWDSVRVCLLTASTWGH